MGHIRLLIDENEELTIEALTNLFELLSNKTVGENVFPTMWKGFSREQVQQLMQCIYGRSAVSVDWRRLVLCLSQPYPLPSSQDLLTALSSMRSTLDGRNNKMITREEYMSVPIWLDERADEDRNARLKPFFFELFKDNSCDTLDYMNMLLLLCSSPDGQEGFFKALSIIKGEPITSSSDTDIALSELQKVINFGATESVPSHESIQEIYDRVGGGGGEKGEDSISTLPLSSLIQDTSLLRLINACNQYHLPDVVSVVIPRPPSMEPRLPTSE
ncbi:PREDICTED: sperm flagellar protein 2-like [Amphimedon queenslandica]|uniref:SPEF2 C-terminal domain-containing protein n=1 Tax=Amphimedon queenslandica TaxID=400682 RepID=A0A1X7UPJ6_AMPQE|nr:PREDICTED: sperm flagellar protein 2-like [Amphimedon queenslandica]|eukprot:XP_019853137.1 PREDICTED: sperm flagellar protein 2-like [Amphimedon queenslandica]